MVFFLSLLVPGTYNLSYLVTFLTGSPSVFGFNAWASDSIYVELNQFSCQCGRGFVFGTLTDLDFSSPSLPPLLSQVFYMVLQLKGDFRVFLAITSHTP